MMPKIKLENIVFTKKDYLEKIANCKKDEVIIFDDCENMFNRRKRDVT